MEFLLGFTFPGKSIVMYNYTMEICSPNWRQAFVNINSIFDTGVIIMISFYYQKVSKSWIFLQEIGTAMTFVSLLFVCAFLTESPKFLYTIGEFSKSKQALYRIAKFNGSEQAADLKDFDFDTETVKQEEQPRNE